MRTREARRVMRNVALGAAISMLGWAPSASATSIPLANLISPAASITAGDKQFTNFSFSATGTGVPAPDPLRIMVTPITDGNPGLHFDTPDLIVTGDGNSLTLHIGFDVTSLGNAIIDAELSFRGRAIVEDVGAIWIGESLTSDAGPIGSLEVFVDPIHGVTHRTDHVEFAPVQSLHVSKDITLNSATIQDFSQTFSQAPEPATLATFATGLAGLVRLRRRRERGQP